MTEVNKALENMLKQHDSIWKTEAAFLSWLRGNIRRSCWLRHPVKLEFIKQNRIKIENPNPRGRVTHVWGGVCALTGETHVLSNLEVDHIKGNHSLRCVDDIQAFVEGISIITLNDLQFVSKEAHKIKSYAEKQGISFEEARLKKKVINICKDKQLLIDTLVKLRVDSIPKTKKGQGELLYKLLLESKNE